MKNLNLNLSLMKATIPITALFFSWSGQAAMEVKGFGLSEQDAILDVYGSCHRLEEPLVIKFHRNTDFVAAGKGWKFDISYRVAEEKKYTTDYFSADHNKSTGGNGTTVIATGPNVNNITVNDKIHTININGTNGGAVDNFIILPTRNIDYLSIGAVSVSNNNGARFIWDKRLPNNTLTGGWLGNPPTVTSWGNMDPNNGSFNLINTDHLSITFGQTMGGYGSVPRWTLDAKKMTFENRGPYTAQQYEAACQ